MDVYTNEYYRWNILLLSIIGIWPYDELHTKRGVQFFISCILLFAVLSQLGGLREVKYELNSILKSISYILITCGFLVKYTNSLMYRAMSQHLLESIESHWQINMNAKELEIMRKYALNGKFHTMMFALMIYPAAIGLILCPFGATILDVVFPLNESRPVEFPIPLDMLFFDRKKHFWWTIVMVTVCTCTAATTVVAGETHAIQCLLHACALLEITSHRIKAAFQACTTDKFITEETATRALISGIEMHERALNFCKFLKSNFTRPYFILLCLGVSSLSIHLFCVSQILAGIEKIEQLLTSSFLCIGTLGYMFYLNYMTQKILDKSGDIFTDAYTSPWYDAPIVMQKLLLFVMLKSMNVFTFDLFGIFSPSIEGFALITRMSVSYFMVLQSFL